MTFLLASLHAHAQEPVLISVNKSDTKKNLVTKGNSTNESFLSLPLSTNAAGNMRFSGDIKPFVKMEHGLFSQRALSYYNVGLGIGTRSLMMDMSLKVAKNGVLPSTREGMRLDIGFSRRWHFRKVRWSKFSVLQRKEAFLNYGVSFDQLISNQNDREESDQPLEKVQFINGKFSVNHPIVEQFLLGVELITHVSITTHQRSYVSAGLKLSYLFTTD